MKVLVTGGLGFIGTRLRKELIRKGHEVNACDMKHGASEDYVRCDVSKYRQVERMLRGGRFDVVYHTAAEYGRWNGEDYYENLWLTNAVGTKNILELQEDLQFRMVFLGSAEVYGDYDGVMTEDTMDRIPIKQMNDYAISKWVNELQILNSAKMHGTESVRVRLFNVYGPGERFTPYRGFIPHFVHKALNGQPYVVYLGHKRTLEYVDDVCLALTNIIENFVPGEVYNLGGAEQHEIKEVSDLILKTLGRDDSQVTYKDSEPFTTQVKTPDSSKAQQDLNFRGSVALEEGLQRTIKWHQEEQWGDA